MVRGNRFFCGPDDARIADGADADFLLKQAPIVRTSDRFNGRAALLPRLRHVGVLNRNRSWHERAAGVGILAIMPLAPSRTAANFSLFSS